MDKKKLNAKDFINIGIFTVIYFVDAWIYRINSEKSDTIMEGNNKIHAWQANGALV